MAHFEEAGDVPRQSTHVDRFGDLRNRDEFASRNHCTLSRMNVVETAEGLRSRHPLQGQSRRGTRLCTGPHQAVGACCRELDMVREEVVSARDEDWRWRKAGYALVLADRAAGLHVKEKGEGDTASEHQSSGRVAG